MKRRNLVAVTGALLQAVALPSLAAAPPALDRSLTVIDVAGHAVPVVQGGLYDRFRSNPPLVVIEQEAPDVDLSWLRTLRKEKVDIGFDTYSPNFYYRNSSLTAVFTANLARLRELIPPVLAQTVQPVQVWPGRGLVAITGYRYRLCDNDSYNEVSISIVTNEPGSTSLGPLTLIGQSLSKGFWGYVLKLPVNTELARVRGVVGYNLPKWLAEIDFREDGPQVGFAVMDSATGQVDFALEADKLDELSAEAELVTNNFTNVDRAGQPTYAYAVSRLVRHASSTNGKAVRLTAGNGALGTFVATLKLGKMIRYQYVPKFQSALYAPRPLAARDASR
ncbi:acetoacetate decarboxylase family protein [Massilia sp. YMA4]|uniref:acetoacetate decarboxylase family protein n=1 Tax=Massilia sp. YMA4 TaxID=1593482 RepID=UPI000DD16B8F|nr:acetoacetate decarboxylase family protein [Massilia sp. YMA4]AXA94192.1 acetoacetate decarboxylase (ADC) [Massilia sp. YMA4]